MGLRDYLNPLLVIALHSTVFDFVNQSFYVGGTFINWAWGAVQVPEVVRVFTIPTITLFTKEILIRAHQEFMRRLKMDILLLLC